MDAKTFYIYLIKLCEKKWYVGRTIDVGRRYTEHVLQNGSGSEWTKLHPPVLKDAVRILKRDADVFDEDKYVKICMAKYGIQNVRGGSYSTIVLNKFVMAQLYNEIKGATDRCFNCGKHGHFTTDCTSTRVTITDNPSVLNKPMGMARKCGKCGLTGHNVRTCPKLIANNPTIRML